MLRFIWYLHDFPGKVIEVVISGGCTGGSDQKGEVRHGESVCYTTRVGEVSSVWVITDQSLNCQVYMKAYLQKTIHIRMLHFFSQIITTLCSSMVRYVNGRPIVYQGMLLAAMMSALKQQHLSHMHRHWLAMLTSSMPYLGRGLSHTVLSTVNQLCRNLELLSQLYQLGHIMRK